MIVKDVGIEYELAMTMMFQELHVDIFGEGVLVDVEHFERAIDRNGLDDRVN